MLGVTRITALTDDAKQAREISAVWSLQRDAELAANPWAFATTRAELAALSTVPAYGYASAFQLPSDFLRMVEVGQYWAMYEPSEAEARFALEGSAVLTNEGSPLRIRYVRRVENAGDWSPLFANAFACRLAMVLAEPLTQSDQKRLRAEQAYGRAIREARRSDAFVKPPQRTVDDSWTIAAKS